MFNNDAAMVLLQNSVDSLFRSGSISEPLKLTNETQLLGPESVFDSIGFVTFITDIEDRMQNAIGKECYLVLNEIAQFDVSSPNLTVDVLIRYLVNLAVS